MEQFFTLWGPASTLFWVRAIWALALFIVMAGLGNLVRRAAHNNLRRAHVHVNAIVFTGRIVQLAFLALGLVIFFAELGVDLSALAAIVGLVTVALSLSLQDITRSLIAGLYLLIERPFQVGDVIDVGGTQGTVEDVGLRTTLMRDQEGNRIIVPNNVLFTSVVTQKKAEV